MTTVEEAKKRGRENHLTNKYNFAGPGTMYAARMKGSEFYENLMKDAGRRVVGTKPYNVAINKLDSCAKVHDKVYNNPRASGAEVQSSDRVFRDCVKKIKPGEDGIQQALLAKAAQVGFDTKLAVENVGLVRKGSFAEGGDKRSTLGKKINSVAHFGKKVTSKIVKGVLTKG